MTVGQQINGSLIRQEFFLNGLKNLLKLPHTHD